MDYTTAEVVAWLETRPADEEYDYTNPRTCLFARFLKDLGHRKVNVTPYRWFSDRGSGLVPEEVNDASNPSETMGEALTLLREVDR